MLSDKTILPSLFLCCHLRAQLQVTVMSHQADIHADTSNSSLEPSEYKLKEAISTTIEAPEIHNGQLHYVRRGQEVTDDTLSTDSIEGYEAEQMRARALLTYEEEKKLLRRIDWHIMPPCSIAFLLKNIDYSNVSNAKIMNTGTHQNILKQLGMTANEFNFVSTIYYVSILFRSTHLTILNTGLMRQCLDSVHHC